jgi:predicted transcriptional regulator
VKQDGVVLDKPGGKMSIARVPGEHEEGVREAVAQCAGECIFIEE